MARNKASTVTVAGRVFYLNNRDMLEEIHKSKEQGQMTNGLAAMLQSLTFRYSQTYRFIGYSFNDDMQSAALLALMTSWNKFDADVGDNPFAYYTQCIKNSFKQYLRNEKTHRDVRDALLISGGMHASSAYTNSVQSSDDNVDHTQGIGQMPGWLD